MATKTKNQVSTLEMIKNLLEGAGDELTLAGLREISELVTEKATLSNSDRMNEIATELGVKAKRWNEAFRYHETNICADVTADMDKLVEEYNDLAEAEALRLCRATDAPLLEAARRLKYGTISYKDAPEDPKNKADLTRSITFGVKYIDTEKLHKSVPGGVGKDASWLTAIQRLNFLLTIRQAYKLGIPKEGLDKISNCYAMKQEAKKFEGLQMDSQATDDVIQADIDKIIKMMIGDEYSAIPGDVAYLEAVYAKKSSKKNLQVAVSNHTNMRNHMMDIAHRACTGEEYTVEVKLNKKAVEAWDAAH